MANIYNLNAKTYLFKFGGNYIYIYSVNNSIVFQCYCHIYLLCIYIYIYTWIGTDIKCFLLIESGVRIHTTQYARDHDKIPSNFATKLRKHLKLKRLECINQIGNDRIIDLMFGQGDKANHLIVEFYAQGNIILTDYK